MSPPETETGPVHKAAATARKGEKRKELEGEGVPDLAGHQVAVGAVAVEHTAEDDALTTEVLPQDHGVLVDALAALLRVDGGDAAPALVREDPAGQHM